VIIFEIKHNLQDQDIIITKLRAMQYSCMFTIFKHFQNNAADLVCVLLSDLTTRMQADAAGGMVGGKRQGKGKGKGKGKGGKGKKRPAGMSINQAEERRA
jgi:hypothetical protein